MLFATYIPHQAVLAQTNIQESVLQHTNPQEATKEKTTTGKLRKTDKDMPSWEAVVWQRLHSTTRQKAIEDMHREYMRDQAYTQYLQENTERYKNTPHQIPIDSNRLGHRGSADIELSAKQLLLLQEMTHKK